MEKENEKAVHGEVKARIYRNILLHRTFTVAELVADTGLRPDQVYPVLAKLRRKGLLTSQGVSGTEKAAHRPNQVYTLSEDLPNRRQLASEIAPFLELTPSELSHSPALERVRSSLIDVTQQLEQIPPSVEKIEFALLHAHLAQLHQTGQLLLETKDDVEIAWYECNRSTKVSLYREFKDAQARLRELSKRIEDLTQRFGIEIEALSAETEFGKLISQALAGKASTKGSDLLPHLHREYNSTDNFYIKRILSEVSARLTFGHERFGNIGTEYAIAEACVRFGCDAQAFSHFLQKLASVDSDYTITQYNLVNSFVLAGKDADAFESWKQIMIRQRDFASILGNLKQLTVFRGAVLVTGDLSQLAKPRLAELENRVGIQGALSVTSTSPVEVFGTPAYVMKTTLADWMEPESSGFVLSASIARQYDDLFVYGPLCDIVQFPGLPRIRLATVLVRLGAKVETAWRVAETLKVGKVALVLHTPEAADNTLLGGLKESLPGFTVQGSFVTNIPQRHVAAAHAAA